MFRFLVLYLPLSWTVVPAIVHAEKCSDYEYVIGKFEDNLPDELFELSVTKMDDEMIRVIIQLEPNTEYRTLRILALRLAAEESNPTVIPLRDDLTPDGLYQGEYWITNSHYAHSSLMVAYEFWRDEGGLTCIEKSVTYIVLMPANNALH